MKSRALAGILLVLGLVVFLTLRFAQGPADATGPDTPRPSGESRPTATLEGAARGAATQLDAVTGAEAIRSAAAEAAAKPADGRATRTITGRVVIAGGCTDDELEVYAVARDSGAGSLNDLLDDPDDKAEPDDESPFEDSPAKEKSKPRILTHAKVDAEGAFRLEVEADRVVHLEARGRYVYTDVARRIEPTNTEPVVLAGDCGTCIVGRLEAPAGDTSSAVNAPTKILLRSSVEDTLVGLEVGRRILAIDGRFVLPAVRHARAYQLDVTPPVLSALHTEVTGCEVGRTRDLVVRLDRGGTVKGRVRDAGGAPVANASVSAKRKGQWFGFDDLGVRKTNSAADGSFVLEGVSVGEVRLVASAVGSLESEPKTLQVTEGGVLADVVIDLTSGASLKGTVAWSDGRPAAGATVAVEFDAGQMFGMTAMNARKGARGKATCDAEGRFVVTGLGLGPFTVRAEALPAEEAATLADSEASTRAKRMHRARKDGVKPGAKELALTLSPPQGLRGRVVDTDGQPVVAFHVHAVAGKSGTLGDLGLDTVDEDVKDPSGSFLVTLPRDGLWRVVVSGKGYAASDVANVTFPTKPEEPELVVTLARCAVVKGVVRDPRGAVVVGADVSLSTGEPGWKRNMPGGTRVRAATNAEGRFTLEGLRAGHVVLAAESKFWAQSPDVALDLVAGEVRENVEFTLREGGRLTGEVYEGGKPASGYFVQVTNTKSADQKNGFADGNGRFEMLHLNPGAYQVIAMPTSALSGENGEPPNQAALMSKLKMASATIVDGQEVHVVLGAPPLEPVKVHGTVTHAGAPYTGAMVMFIGDKKDVLSSLKSATVAADGSYEIELEGAGRYSVTIQKTSGNEGDQQNVEFTRTIPAEKDVRLDFQMPNGRISGRVKGPDGAPAAKITITVLSDEGLRTGTMMGGQYSTTTTDAEGRYDVQALRPGSFTVQAGASIVEAMLGTGASVGRASLHGVKVSENEWKKDVDLRLQEPATVRVKVIDEAGNLVEGAHVFARDEDGHLLDAFSVVSTGKDGVARYEGLGAGRFTFQARVKDRATGESERITVEAGETKDLEMTLREATRLVVRVQDENGGPAEAIVTVLDEAGRDVASMFALSEISEAFSDGTLSRDVQRVGPLPRGKYRVKATRDDGKSVEKSVTLSGQAEKSVTLKFDA